ncbi:hypothetical protein CLOM_g6300 [Closterium sp. NIES-68]|nr:hypothetical protein CLOM_g3214 [Closterium sp. NIES-68]GJP47067.1 hypothetical protein CLOM_g6300 [Closterium sp. NIES-68]GJP76360.1 hypothetical protein CLOP_g6816 [Closterium sp. NIES-67]
MAIRVTGILVAVLCLAAVASSASVPQNLTALHREGPRRALQGLPPFDAAAAALGAAAGAMAGAVQSAAATLASTIAQAPGGLLFDDASKICVDFGLLPACDFYFDLLGPLGLPSLRFPVVSGGALVLSQQNGDRPVSLAIATDVSPGAGEIVGDKKKKGGYQVEIDATGPAEYCKCEAAKLAKSVAHAGDQFYATGQPAKVYARTFQKNLPASAFKGCCVRLPLTSVQLKAPNGDIINLNKGDGNKQFPEKHRCLLFHVLTV